MTAAPNLETHAVDTELFGQDWSLSVVVRRDTDGPPLARRDLGDADLAEARREAWYNGILRKGSPDAPFETVETRVAPVHKDDRCIGFLIEAQRAESIDRTYHAFSLSFISPIAQSMGERLFEQGALARGDTFVYELQARPGSAAAGPGPETGSLKITTETLPPSYAVTRLRPIVAQARTVGDISAACFPVIFSESAHARAEHYARKGAANIPPLESGALLIGRLCACPESGEMFVVVVDAVEVFDATQREFALIYTSATWSQVETILQAYRTRPGGGLLRLVGQSHGHNFGIEGEPCSICAESDVCGRTNVFVSTEDRRFMRAVFAGQPWALCWIAGTNARAENVIKLFTLRRGALLERGYHVVEDQLLQDPQ
ncbi:MAG: hypothetical protein ACYSU7_16345 [Planctomycetota bacterium]|jgi:hypothetical protein